MKSFSRFQQVQAHLQIVQGQDLEVRLERLRSSLKTARAVLQIGDEHGVKEAVEQRFCAEQPRLGEVEDEVFIHSHVAASHEGHQGRPCRNPNEDVVALQQGAVQGGVIHKRVEHSLRDACLGEPGVVGLVRDEDGAMAPPLLQKAHQLAVYDITASRTAVDMKGDVDEDVEAHNRRQVNHGHDEVDY